jgi:long-chain acyl-CoA synthetase
MPTTIPAQVLRNAHRIPNQPALLTRGDEEWEAMTWAEYGTAVRNAGKALIAAGVGAGDRVAILGYNRPEWVIFDVAAMAIGAVPTGIYFTSSTEECAYIIEHSGSGVVLIEGRSHWKRIEEVRARLVGLRTVVLMDPVEGADDPDTVTWDDFLASGGAVTDAEFEARLDAIRPDDPATIIYTATGAGPVMGAVLTHDNLAFTGRSSVDTFNVTPQDSALSYLPLSHVAEQIFTILAPAHVGYWVYFAQSIRQLRSNLREVEPSIFFGVPRLWVGFEMGVRKELGKLEGRDARIAAWALDVGHRVAALRNRGETPGTSLAVQHRVADRLFFQRIKGNLGLRRARIVFSGAAPVAASTLEFFGGIDLAVRSVYGMSEATGPTTADQPGATRFGTVGRSMQGIEIRTAQDGEVLVGGRSVFSGYLDAPDATAATLGGGWLHSGDLGSIDADGFLTITGRKKDIIITNGGKNVAARPLEAALADAPVIDRAVLVGEGRDHIGALMSLDGDVIAGMSVDERDAAVQAAVDVANAPFARVEQVRRYGVLSRPLRVDLGEVTADGMVDRRVVGEHFFDEIDAIYR